LYGLARHAIEAPRFSPFRSCARSISLPNAFASLWGPRARSLASSIFQPSHLFELTNSGPSPVPPYKVAAPVRQCFFLGVLPLSRISSHLSAGLWLHRAASPSNRSWLPQATLSSRKRARRSPISSSHHLISPQSSTFIATQPATPHCACFLLRCLTTVNHPRARTQRRMSSPTSCGRWSSP
jgi:hypothetical protein